MAGFEIEGLNDLQRRLEEASEAFSELDGEITTLRFDPGDRTSVDAAILDMERAIDLKMARFSGNEIVASLIADMKSRYREEILSQAGKRTDMEDHDVSDGQIDQALLRQIENAITDLRRSEYNTFDRHIKKLDRLLRSPQLASINDELTAGIDVDAWLAAGEATQGSMVGSAQLEWPDDPCRELGMNLSLVRDFAKNPDKATGFAHTFYYNGTNSISSNLQGMVEQVFVPFARDYINHVKARTATTEATLLPQRAGPAARKAFVVHGHDERAREAVARFLERIGFEAIILYEQANQGRTVIEKIEAHGEVGFAVVLLTPDDVGGAKGGELQARARQNVLLELGYFIGRLGRSRVCALKRGEVEIPSDFGGVVYETFDAGGGWKQAIGKELAAAGFEIDWNKVMRP